MVPSCKPVAWSTPGVPKSALQRQHSSGARNVFSMQQKVCRCFAGIAIEERNAANTRTGKGMETRGRTITTILSACEQVLDMVEPITEPFPAAKVCYLAINLYPQIDLSRQGVILLCRKLIVLESARRDNNEQIVAVYHSIVRIPRPRCTPLNLTGI
jgi:hypothetical protein